MVCVLAIAVASLCLFVKFSSAVPSALLDQASLKVNSLGVEKLHRGTKKYIELLKVSCMQTCTGPPTVAMACVCSRHPLHWRSRSKSTHI